MGMDELIARYQFRDEVLEADSCVALVDAIEKGEVAFGGFGRGSYPGEAMGQEFPYLRSVGYWSLGKEGKWCLEEHRNEGIELCFLESGSLPFALRDRWQQMEGGDFTVTRPWQPHGLGRGIVPPSKLIWFIVDVGVRMPNQAWVWPDWIVLSEQDKQELSNLLRQNETPIRHADRAMVEAFVKLRQTLESPRPIEQVSTVAVLINAILLGLLQLLKSQRPELDENLSSARRAVQVFLGDIAKHPSYMARAWTLEEMAKECHLGRTAFTQTCKELTNQTPFEYLAKIRVEAAKRLIVEHPDKSLTEIGYEMGFGSSAYFSKVFREQMGVTPSAYRKL